MVDTREILQREEASFHFWQQVVGGEVARREVAGCKKSTLDGLQFEQAPRVGDGQGSLLCFRSWGHK